MRRTISQLQDIKHKIINGRNSLSPSARSILEQVGDASITHIKIGRTPIPTVITTFLRIVSSTPYDKLFHLFLIVTTVKGTVRLEKNEVIKLTLNPSHDREGEYFTIHHIPSHLTLNKLLEDAERRMGEQRFFSYSAYGNNCQDFLLGILTASNIMDGRTFIKQDTEDIFANNTRLRKLANTITDFAARADVLKEGGQLSMYIDKNNGLYDYEISHILEKNGYHINGVYSKDELPKVLKNGWYIINMQSSNAGGGTHWVCFRYINNGNLITYFDAFGQPPPIEVMERAKNDILYSTKEIQDMNSSACGWFCIGAIVYDMSFSNPKANFNRYLAMFSSKPSVNDGILLDFLRHRHII